ncbi:hypothetical protein ACH5RR_032346 [Cinchona calisaya]|uniref:inositol-1,3,4-trisphosphate 5/6-kinase n=1 Tax=Cinchona calisaya TaxID=153742 RepID=A0ABD2YLX7_9GENT
MGMDGDSGGGLVNGILLDASLLFASDHNNQNLSSASASASASLLPAADSLLRKLRYSKIRTGIFYEPELSAIKVCLLEEMTRLKLFDSLIAVASSIENVVSEVALTWGENIASHTLVVSGQEELCLKLRNSGWMTAILRSPGHGPANDIEFPTGSETSSSILINKLEELPLTVCHLNKKAESKENILVVGYIMKPSREEDFAKRGAFPLYPTQDGLIFLPLNYELPIPAQLQQVDILLHKATDEIVDVEMSTASEFVNTIEYTKGMQELQRYIEHHLDCCVIDPFPNICPVLDRLKIQQILFGLENLCLKSCYKIRGPRFLKVESFKEPNLQDRLFEAKLSLPNIVKPQVACGVAVAHSMAIVFKMEDYKDLNVPLPAVVQEYVDHSSCLFKFYVLGEKVYYAIKKSTPNAATLMSLSEEGDLKPILFDSLKSLPIDKKNQQLEDGVNNAGNHQIDLELVTDAANWLRNVLNLTIFGFDVVIQEATGDHVVVDLNYLPSFKEVPDDVAVPAFWEAIKWRFRLWKGVEKA